MLNVAAYGCIAIVATYLGFKSDYRLLFAILFIRIFCDGAYTIPVGSLPPVNNLLGLLVIFLSLGLVMRQGKPLTGTVFILFLLAISAGFASFGPAGNSAWDYYLKATSFILWWVAVRDLPGLNLDKLLWFLTTLGVFSSFFSLWQFATGQNVLLVDGALRIAGLLAHPNSAALVYSISICCGIALVSRSKKKLIPAVFLVLLVTALALTISLMGLATVGVILLTYFSFSYKSGKRRVNNVAIVGMFFLLSLFLLSPLATQRLVSFLPSSNTTTFGESNSLQWRLGRWQELLPYWQGNPIFGMGYGSSTSGSLLQGYPPHNDYLRILVDLGLVGLTVAIFAASKFLFDLSSSSLEGQNSDVLVSARVARAIFVGFLVNCFTENTFTYAIPVYMLGLAVGFVYWGKREFQISKREKIMD